MAEEIKLYDGTQVRISETGVLVSGVVGIEVLTAMFLQGARELAYLRDQEKQLREALNKANAELTALRRQHAGVQESSGQRVTTHAVHSPGERERPRSNV